MSRIGKLPIPVLDGAKVTLKDRTIRVEGPKGVLSRELHPKVDLEIKDNAIHVTVSKDKDRAAQGLVRSLVNNMVVGVTTGFERTLEVNGIGYRATVNGSILNLNLGFSHSVDFPLPKGVDADVDKNNNIKLTSFDKELLGQTAASIRSLRPPEPYKGKGIKYSDERIQRKAGKTGAAA